MKIWGGGQRTGDDPQALGALMAALMAQVMPSHGLVEYQVASPAVPEGSGASPSPAPPPFEWRAFDFEKVSCLSRMRMFELLNKRDVSLT